MVFCTRHIKYVLAIQTFQAKLMWSFVISVLFLCFENLNGNSYITLLYNLMFFFCRGLG